MRKGLDSKKASESPIAVADQLEIEIRLNEERIKESAHFVDSSSLKQWCVDSLELVNKAIYITDQRSPTIQSFTEKQQLIDRLYAAKVRITEIHQKLINPRSSLSPQIKHNTESQTLQHK
jgi:hypothetical protein